MTTILLLLFTFAWAVVAFGVIRVLLVVWRVDRRLATVTAGAVAAAFFLGSSSPFAFWHRVPAVAAGGAAAAGGAPPAPIAAHCPANAKVATVAGAGHIDTATISGNPVNAAAEIDLPPHAQLRLTGWSITSGGPVADLCLVVDGNIAPFTGLYGIDRPDVAAALGKPADRPSGFDVTFKLKPGLHTITVGSAEADGMVRTLVPLRVRAH